MKKKWRAVALACALALSTRVGANAVPDVSAVLLTGVNVISLHDGSIAKNRSIFVRGDRIVAVLTAGSKMNIRTRKIRLSGAYVLPGFTESHVHLPTDAIYRAFGSLKHITL